MKTYVRTPVTVVITLIFLCRNLQHLILATRIRGINTQNLHNWYRRIVHHSIQTIVRAAKTLSSSHSCLTLLCATLSHVTKEMKNLLHEIQTVTSYQQISFDCDIKNRKVLCMIFPGPRITIHGHFSTTKTRTVDLVKKRHKHVYELYLCFRRVSVQVLVVSRALSEIFFLAIFL